MNNILFLTLMSSLIVLMLLLTTSCTPKVVVPEMIKEEQAVNPPPMEYTAPEPEEFTFPIYFDFDDKTLSSEAKEALDTMPEKRYVESIVITGYTDTNGSEEYNRQLSLDRALAVYDYVNEKYKDSDILIWVDAGGELDIAPWAARMAKVKVIFKEEE